MMNHETQNKIHIIIKESIEKEDKFHPLGYSDLVSILSNKGYSTDRHLIEYIMTKFNIPSFRKRRVEYTQDILKEYLDRQSHKVSANSVYGYLRNQGYPCCYEFTVKMLERMNHINYKDENRKKRVVITQETIDSNKYDSYIELAKKSNTCRTTLRRHLDKANIKSGRPKFTQDKINKIKYYISTEDKFHPYTDEQLSELLIHNNIMYKTNSPLSYSRSVRAIRIHMKIPNSYIRKKNYQDYPSIKYGVD